MEGPEQLPSEGEEIKTYVGTGLANPSKVKAKVKGVRDDQISFETLEIIEQGDGDTEVGEIYGADPDGFFWET